MDSDKCELCNLGSYQDEEGRVECQPCSRGFSTKNFGAKSEEDCLREWPSFRFSGDSQQNDTRAFWAPWRYVFLPCGHLNLGSAVTAQNDEFEAVFILLHAFLFKRFGEGTF